MNKQKEAKDLLLFYVELIGKKSGLDWNNENRAEVALIIDLIIAAVKEEAK